ncbi:hypothetical protein IZU27_03170 [Treponema socranskii]|uniref:hypothetical protein n=1 Tax=Treponema socranskii TaxID=53419 RepID=UPI003D8C37BC
MREYRIHLFSASRVCTCACLQKSSDRQFRSRVLDTPARGVQNSPLLRFSASPLLRFSASPLLRFSASPLLRFSASPLLRFSAED